MVVTKQLIQHIRWLIKLEGKQVAAQSSTVSAGAPAEPRGVFVEYVEGTLSRNCENRSICVQIVPTHGLHCRQKDYFSLFHLFFFCWFLLLLVFAVEQWHAKRLAKRRSCREVMRSFRGGTYLAA